MKNEEILRKAIEKAIKNGFRWNHPLGLSWSLWAISRDIYTVIFSHDFAKAFFGEEIKSLYKTSEMRKALNEEILICKKPAWQLHLQQMVLEEEPLKYLEKFLEK